MQYLVLNVSRFKEKKKEKTPISYLDLLRDRDRDLDLLDERE